MQRKTFANSLDSMLPFKPGHEVAKSEVRMPTGPLKAIGDYPISVALHHDVSCRYYCDSGSRSLTTIEVQKSRLFSRLFYYREFIGQNFIAYNCSHG